jgi:hypothetical protein
MWSDGVSVVFATVASDEYPQSSKACGVTVFTTVNTAFYTVPEPLGEFLFVVILDNISRQEGMKTLESFFLA